VSISKEELDSLKKFKCLPSHRWFLQPFPIRNKADSSFRFSSWEVFVDFLGRLGLVNPVIRC